MLSKTETPKPNALIAPSLPDALPPLPGEQAFLLPVERRASALKVRIDELWAGYVERQFVNFFWDDTNVGQEQVLNPDPSQFPMDFEVPGITLTGGGIHTLHYLVTAPGGTEGSDIIHVDLDNIPPHFNQRPTAPAFPDEIITRGVTQDYLIRNEDRVIATVERWLDIRLGDELWYFLMPSVVPTVETLIPAGQLIIADEHLLLPEIEVSYPGEVFRQLGNVNCYGYYFLRDRAGNEGQDSFPSEIFAISLDPTPVLLAPEVPVYDEHGLIDEEVARLPIQVVVPAMEHVVLNDQVIIHWGLIDLPTATVTNPDANPLLQVNIPYLVIQNGGNGTLAVTYDLLRNGVSLGRSPEKLVEVNISLPGGPDPDPETPEHENLQLPMALGASGVPNIISAADLEQPADVIIEWFGNDNEAVFEEHDEVQANWSQIVLRHTVTADEVINAQPLRLAISSEQMKQAGPGQHDLFYTITRQLPTPPGHANTALSETQVITVADASELPGGGDPLPAADFPEKNIHNAINRDAAVDGTPYKILLDYQNAAVGDRIDFKFRGHQGFASDPELEPTNPIEGSYMEASHVLTAGDLNEGSYSFTVGRAQLVAINYASGNGYHWITNNAGTVPAEHYHVFVDTGDLEP